MKRAGIFVVVGIFSYLLVLFFTMPAALVEGYLEKQIRGLSLSAVSGSVFYGGAGRISYRGSDLGVARWSFKPLALLTGRVEYHVEFPATASPGHANVGVSFVGNAYGYDIDMNLSPNELIDRYSPVVVESSGYINLLIETFKLSDGFPRDFTGRVLWRNAAILSPVEMLFGDTVLDLHNDGEQLVGRVGNEGEFEISGEITLKPDGEYVLDLMLSPGLDVSKQTVLLLESTTTVQAGGKYLLRSSGSW